jgi:cardiolipin synthase A/B
LLEAPWWLLGLAGFGLLAIAAAVLTLFFSLGRRPDRIWIDKLPPFRTEEFLQTIAGILNAPLMRGGHARLLVNGSRYYPRILECIAGAQKTVNVMTYIWEPGRVSDRFFDVLCDRAHAGVEVRVLLDGFGCMQVPREKVEQLEAAGARVAWFRPLKFGKLLRFHRRNHRRAFVVDGRIGFTGGAAIADKWDGDARNPDEWRDDMVEVTGRMALNLQSAFAELWAYSGGELLTGEDYFPHRAVAGEGDTPHIHVVSSPASDSHPLRLFFLVTFFAAREKLYIASPYFVPDSFMREVLIYRARAGVDVRILMPNELSDAAPIRYASHSYYEELLAGGIRLYEFQPSMMHSKLLVADGEWCVVGSANMDVRSKELNKENVLGIRDRRLGQEIEAVFLADLERSTEILPAQWRRRGIGRRILERASVLFAEQY